MTGRLEEGEYNVEEYNVEQNGEGKAEKHAAH
jgi:hypothetical protein